MTVAPDYVFPEVSNEVAAGESYYSGNKVFTSDGDNETWTETAKPTDNLTDTRELPSIEERLQEIEEALGL